MATLAIVFNAEKNTFLEVVTEENLIVYKSLHVSKRERKHSLFTISL